MLNPENINRISDIPGYTNRPTWLYTSPHNIKRNTDQAAGCATCHPAAVGSDWVNLRTPERSRILRAPLAKSTGGLGLAWCRDRKARKTMGMITQRNQPPDVFRQARAPKPEAI